MSNISDERLKNVIACVKMFGKERARDNFDLSDETLNRYLREARGRGFDDIADEVFEGKPKVLIFDIETAPTSAFVWRLFKENIPINFVESEWYIVSWAAKWLFDDEVFSQVLTSEEALRKDDKRIVDGLWKFIDDADILCGHNIKQYDVKRVNTRFLIHGMQPPSPYQQIDTLEVAKKHFAPESRKLDYLARLLGVEGKMKHEGADLWVKCYDGDKDALKTMDEYCRQDINVTEEVYVKLRPYIKSHPNMALYYDDMHTRCPNCGSTDLQYDTGKFYYTSVNKYSSIKCRNCGASGRARTTAISKQKSQSVITTQAR